MNKYRVKLHVVGFSAALLVVSGLPAQDSDNDIEFVCPMDPDVRSKFPAKCPRCGMKLEPGIAAPAEYILRLRTKPRAPKPGRKTLLRFDVTDPETGKSVRDFEVIHEKRFHLFIVSEDLEFFAHEHPERASSSSFRQEAVFPKPGHYRLLADFYPSGGTPQLIAKSLITEGAGDFSTRVLKPDLAVKHGENLSVSLITEPAEPIAGHKTLLFFRLKNAEGLEPYLGALGHMLAVSDDLIDMVHQHPAFPEALEREGELQVQFNIIFPRERMYRLWVQFQNKGVVNTVAFDVPVVKLG